ncbi:MULTISPECIES: hypothetical protein [Exiguobacterium]|uniref:hypothetical protein n=1 Tax=Exiguobacterium sp. UBA1053 TaxID=1946487 RepID=UPI0025B8C9B0|nr:MULTISPECIES: hypothetical protein [Exiguobacterium]
MRFVNTHYHEVQHLIFNAENLPYNKDMRILSRSEFSTLFKLDRQGLLSLKDSNMLICLMTLGSKEHTLEYLSRRVHSPVDEVNNALKKFVDLKLVNKVEDTYDFLPFNYILFNFHEDNPKFKTLKSIYQYAQKL